MNQNKTQIFIVLAIILLTALMRIFNAQIHLYHLVPVAALGIFSGSILNNKSQAYLIPIGAMILSDIGIALFTNIPGFYGISQFVNYGALIFITFLGTYLSKRNFLNIVGFSVGGTLLFFILSNFGTFLSGTLYTKDLQGLIECYTMALPFYKNELANTFFLNSLFGDLSFSLIAFGIYHIAQQNFSSLKTAR